MVYTSAIKLPRKEESKTYIFLAGSIDLHLEGNWREKIISEIGGDIHFFDPTCLNHDDLDDFQMEKHIKWELDALEMADKVLLNFLPNSESPISLVELGLYTFTNKLIVVCPKGFHKYRYIRVLCDKYKTPIVQHLSESIAFFEAAL